MNAFEGKKSADKWFPVRLVDSTDLVTPETGKVFGDITCKYGYEAATSESTHTVTTDDWKEQGDGNYWLRIGAGEFAAGGKYIVKVECGGCHDYSFVVEVRDKTIAELIDEVHIAKAGVANKMIENSDTGEIDIYDDDGVTKLVELELDSADSGKTVIRQPK